MLKSYSSSSLLSISISNSLSLSLLSLTRPFPLLQYDPNWAASWDPTNQAYYYYHTITGLTQWEPPYGFDTSAIQQQQADQEALPDELARELARDVRVRV